MPVSFHLDGEPFIVCRQVAGGMTHRRAIAATVSGSALLGPAEFPVQRPETFDGERAVWRRGGWVIVTRKPKR